MKLYKNRISHILLAMIPIIGLTACAGGRNNIEYEMEKMTARQPIIPQFATLPTTVSDGSLWQDNAYLNGMFIDTKARNIGDNVTVQIEESAKASNKANTETERTSGLEAGIEKLFGLEDWWNNDVLPEVPDELPRLTPFGDPSIKGRMKSEFEGDGETSRSGSLDAFITCRVVDVLPNGNLKIVGTREVMVNYENQMIILSGIIRPRDIAENNVIKSKFVSDAKIAYSGSGVINDRQRPGWLTNLMNTVWPF
ncbi:MAG: flagellar basal body L-ring protein FlgH [Desulfobacterales bacterium]|nr:flagellar basal body L-ring protein FlgH [Desulfobacterales bacterium]